MLYPDSETICHFFSRVISDKRRLITEVSDFQSMMHSSGSVHCSGPIIKYAVNTLPNPIQQKPAATHPDYDMP